MTRNEVATPQEKKSMRMKLLRPYIMEDQAEACSLVLDDVHQYHICVFSKKLLWQD